MALGYSTVRVNVTALVIDGIDSDDLPDDTPLSGTIVLTPMIQAGRSIQYDDAGVLKLKALTEMEVDIGATGDISNHNRDFVKVVAPTAATTNMADLQWKATFKNLRYGLKSTSLDPIYFYALPDAVINLAEHVNVAPNSTAVQLARGPRGYGVLDAIAADIAGDPAFVLELESAAGPVMTAPIPLPPAPADDAAMAANVTSETSATRVALNNTYAPLVGSDARKVWSVDPAVAGGGYTPSQRTAYFHNLIAQIVAAGGSNVIEFPALNFVVAIENTVASLSGSTVLFILPSGTALNFRPGTKVTVDATSAAASDLVLMWQFGTGTTAASDFAVRDATFSNKALANGKSIWGAGNRRDTSTAKTDNVTYERCVFDDVTVGVTNARRNPSASLGANRDQNWRVINCDFRTSNNRAIELSQTNGGLIQGNTFTAVESAIHLLLYTEGVKSRDNRGTTTDSAIRVNVGVKNCQFDGGRYEFVPGVTSNYGTFHFHTEPGIATYETSDLDIRNHYFGAPDTGSIKKALSFMATNECTSAKINRVRFSSCTFAGTVDLTPFYTKQGHEMDGWVFTDCDFNGNFVNVASTTHNIHDWTFINCRFHASTGDTINANRMFFRGCTFDATPTISASANDTEMINCTSPAAITDNGVGSTVTGTTIRTGAKLDPANIVGATTWDADDLTAGTFTTWTPKAGSAETSAFAPVTTAPTVVDAAMGAHKAVRFTAASQHRLLSGALSAPKAQPYTLAYLWKTTANASDQYLVAGNSLNQLVSRHLQGGQMAHRSSAAGTPIQPTTTRAFDAWHCTIVVYNGTSSKTFTDGVAGRSGTLTDVEALSALRIGSSGTGSATATLNGDIALLSLIPSALSDADVAKVMRWLGARAGVTIS